MLALSAGRIDLRFTKDGMKKMNANEVKDRIFASFSGGRSSAMMCSILLDKFPNHEIQFVFANTGEEHEETLKFVDKCDKFFGLNLIWVEAVTHHNMRLGCTHKIVDYASASRKGEPFKEVISKYGIPNKSYPHCTRELKLNPMYSFIKNIGWAKGSYNVAIGIRADEPDRFDKKAKEKGIIYPLADEGIEKSDVLEWWKRMPFDLKLPEHFGNCKTCWKKSDLKLVSIIKQHPDWFTFNAEMEEKYSNLKVDEKHEPRVFFRSKRSTKDLFLLANAFDGEPDERHFSNKSGGCSESCEAFLYSDEE